MPKNTSINLSDHFCRFIDEQVQTGRYGSASEVVREGLRLLEEHDLHVRELREALRTGEESGPAAPLDMTNVKALARKRARTPRAA